MALLIRETRTTHNAQYIILPYYIRIILRFVQ